MQIFVCYSTLIYQQGKMRMVNFFSLANNKLQKRRRKNTHISFAINDDDDEDHVHHYHQMVLSMMIIIIEVQTYEKKNLKGNVGMSNDYY